MAITGTQLRAARKAKGWTQQELAKRAGIGIATVERMERYKDRYAHGDRLKDIAQALGIKLWAPPISAHSPAQ